MGPRGRVAMCIAVLLVAACTGGGTNPLTGEPGSDKGFRLNLDIVLPPDVGPPDVIRTPPVSDVGVVAPDVSDRRGRPCVENAECGPGGWCVPGPDGRVCTITCVDTCPDDWACAGVEGLGSDLIFLCLPREPAVCAGCVRAEDCPTPTVCADLRSEDAVIGQGACMLPCEGEGATCASGFECVPRRRVDGPLEPVCAPKEDTGCCSTVTTDSVEACALENEHGRCWGSRRCRGVEGWGVCEAQLPAAEICDGTDNDCDGSFDEDLPELCACGDGDCVGGVGEDARTCPIDCAACGDGICSPAENPQLCPEDCCGVRGRGGCGDGVCVGFACDEGPTTCPTDCGRPCGDDRCEAGESPWSCPADCQKQICGNGLCEPTDGGIDGCPSDCGAACGNCVCEPSESFVSCPVDCGHCGDGVCSLCAQLREDEACPADCPRPRAEVCDGLDQDNDGEVDEDACDDSNPCTIDTCEGDTGFCRFEPAPSRTVCDDGDACTTEHECAAGRCVGTEQAVCEDGIACTMDGCDSALGCVFEPDASQCPDEHDCTVDECDLGSGCRHIVVHERCEDGEACTLELCDEIVGCVFTRREGECEDGDPCTDGDTCAGGVCAGGGPRVCADATICTDDGCEPETGCTFTPAEGPCDDGNACTVDDACDGGSCAPGAARGCDDGSSCTDDACDPETGCTHGHNTFACDDEDACTSGDVCHEGVCAGPNPVPCDDEEPCTDDSCDPESGCVFAEHERECDDGLFCTVDDVCGEGACVGARRDCGDWNICTLDGCTEEEECTHEPKDGPCDDENACTSTDVCEAGECVPGPEVVCDDGVHCTDDDCEPATGCVHPPNTRPCDDGNACTKGDRCGGGLCNGTGFVVCVDEERCTDDSCDPDSGCVYRPNTKGCEDGDPCTLSDVCAGGGCTSGAIDPCDDGEICTADSCATGVGCRHDSAGGSCDDGDACTIDDACSGGACAGGGPRTCTDGNECTDDGCAPQSGCTFDNHTRSCDDGVRCTVADACTGGRRGLGEGLRRWKPVHHGLLHGGRRLPERPQHPGLR